MSMPPEVKSVILLASTVSEPGYIERLSRRQLGRTCRDLAHGVHALCVWIGEEASRCSFVTAAGVRCRLGAFHDGPHDTTYMFDQA